MIRPIDGFRLSKLCDYSFGDQSGSFGRVPNWFQKPANNGNIEFLEVLNSVSEKRDWMTLYIDNIRLYNREISQVKDSDREYVRSLMRENNLLELCGQQPHMKFIIFTGLEDTPLDMFIVGQIPDNVIRINAAQGLHNVDKVKPLANGIQRKMYWNDFRSELISWNLSINLRGKSPRNLLYINHSDKTNPKRARIKEIFRDQSFAKVVEDRRGHSRFYSDIQDSAFVICPEGNGLDCHREWEVIYLGRVPVIKRHPYLEHLHRNDNVLFVDDYEEVTEDLLQKNIGLLEGAQGRNLGELDLENYFREVLNDSLKVVD